MRSIYKVLLVGNRGVGKTTFIQKYLGMSVDTRIQGVYTMSMIMEKGGIYMMVWDNPMPYHYVHADGAIIMGNDPLYWYSRVYDICGDIPMVSMPDKREICTYDPFMALLDG